MGGILSVSLSCDEIITRCCNCIQNKSAFICQLKENLTDLETETARLRDLKSDKIRKIDIDERHPYVKRLDQVQGWISRVDAKLTEIEEMRNKEAPLEMAKPCLEGGCFSKNCRSRYASGKKVFEMLSEVRTLKDEGECLKDLTEKVLPDKVQLQPVGPTVGMGSLVDEVCSCIMDQQRSVIGIQGTGGVGKTTLLKKVNNKLSNMPYGYDFGIWVTVSKVLEKKAE